MRRVLCLLVVVASAACSRAPSEPPPSPDLPPQAPHATPSAAAPPPHSAAHAPIPLRWDDPPRWTRRTPSTPMRQAEYLVPRAAGDSDDAECFVITFGPGQGGSVDDNIERWVKQLEPTTTRVERTTRTAGGLAITRVEVGGTYTPMPMGGKAPGAPRPGYRLVGEIVEAPSGPWFFKLVGPEATVKAAAKELDALVDSVRPG